MPCCPRTTFRLLSPVLIAEIVLLLTASPASAQVALLPDAVPEGGTHTMIVRLSNERSSGTATRYELTFPREPPLVVDATAAPGWTVTRRDRALDSPLQVDGQTAGTATDAVTFSGVGVRPGYFQDFQLTLGPLPPSGAVVFSAKQTSSDGSVVTWRRAADPATPRITVGARTVPIPAPATPESAPPTTAPVPPVPVTSPATTSPSTSAAAVPEPDDQVLVGASPGAARPAPSPWALLGVCAGLAALLLAGVSYPALRSRRGAAHDADPLFEVFDDDGRAPGTAPPEVTSR